MSAGGQPGSDQTGHADVAPTAAASAAVKVAYTVPAVPVLVLAANPGSGKTRLLEQWASQVPDGQRWTFITRGETVNQGEQAQDELNTQADGPRCRSEGAHVIHLAHDCACCNGRMVLKTHVARTLRMRRPDRLFIEAFLDDHLPKTLAWLAGPEWEGWLTQVRCMALLPLVPPKPDEAMTESALSCADVLCFVTPRAPVSRQTPHTTAVLSASTETVPAVQAAQRLLQARQLGGPDQWRINAPLEKLDWGVIEQTLGTARRRI